MAFHSSSRRPSTTKYHHASSPSFTQSRIHPTLSLAPSPSSKSSETPKNAVPEEGIVSGGGGGGGVGAGSGEAMPSPEDLGAGAIPGQNQKGEGGQKVEGVMGEMVPEYGRDVGSLGGGDGKRVVKGGGMRNDVGGDRGDVSKFHPAWEGFGKGPGAPGKEGKGKARQSKL